MSSFHRQNTISATSAYAQMKKHSTHSNMRQQSALAHGKRTGATVVLLAVETRADRQILERLIAKFDTEPLVIDISGVSFFVRSRIVTLNGFIREASDRTRIISLAKETSGVERVIDRLRVAPVRFQSRFLKRSA